MPKDADGVSTVEDDDESAEWGWSEDEGTEAPDNALFLLASGGEDELAVAKAVANVPHGLVRSAIQSAVRLQGLLGDAHPEVARFAAEIQGDLLVLDRQIKADPGGLVMEYLNHLPAPEQREQIAKLRHVIDVREQNLEWSEVAEVNCDLATKLVDQLARGVITKQQAATIWTNS